MKAFGARGAGRPIPTDPKDWSTKIVAVTTQGNDVVCVASVSTRPDPRNPGQTYTTTHFDMWRFVDGKADEHWDEGQISAAPAGGRGPGGPAPGARQ
jgi:predicted SnoaL-like aldol condensation-catalyzing enzyme